MHSKTILFILGILFQAQTSAQTLSCGSTQSGSIISSTGQWWSFTTPSSGTVTISTCGSNFDTEYFIYSGYTRSTSSSVWYRCDDCTSYCTTANRAHQTFTIGGSGNAVLQASTLYSFRLHGFNGGTGSYSLMVTCSGVQTTTRTISGTLSCSSSSSRSISSSLSTYQTRYYSFQVPSGPSRITISTCGSSFDTYLEVYQSSSSSTSSPFYSCNDCGTCGNRAEDTFTVNGLGSRTLASGTTYDIGVYGNGIASGNFIVSVDCCYSNCNTSPGSSSSGGTSSSGSVTVFTLLGPFTILGWIIIIAVGCCCCGCFCFCIWWCTKDKNKHSYSAPPSQIQPVPSNSMPSRTTYQPQYQQARPVQRQMVVHHRIPPYTNNEENSETYVFGNAQNCSSLVMRLRNISPSGQTAFYDATILGVQRMLMLYLVLQRETGGQLRHRFLQIILTDGEDNSSGSKYEDVVDVMHKIRELGSICQTIFIGVGTSPSVNRQLQAISVVGGDNSQFYPVGNADIESIFERLKVTILRQRVGVAIAHERGVLVGVREQHSLNVDVEFYAVQFMLDISGSMSGSKWTSVCNSVEKFLSHLTEADLISCAVFNDKPRFV